MNITIHPQQVTFSTRSGVSAKTGKPYTMREQQCYVDLGDIYPVLVKFNLDEGQPPYPAGEYTLHPSSYKVGQFGSLMIDRLVLVPADA